MELAARLPFASLDSVPVHSRSTKSCRASENTEQVFNVVADIHKHGDAHHPSDNNGGQCRDTDQVSYQARAAKHSLNLETLNPLHHVISGGSLDSTDFHRGFTSPSKSLDKSPISDQANPVGPERTEVPNTPTQQSSQLHIPSPLLNLRGGATQEDIVPSAGSLYIEPTPPARITFGTVLCTVCHKQRLLAKSGNTKAIW
jgi:hypothetical protein